ncbi:MAG TPA: hypothetical protein VMW76_01895 [Bacteroidales bacterium]|nr:hypothetical protein [Bacteroidales bacterium]
MRRILKIFSILILISPVVTGQKLVNSPYSRFGPGTLEPQGVFKIRSMGGSGVAIRDPVSVNFLNPASFSAVDTNSFVFDFGLDYQVNYLVTSEESYFSDDMNFHHLAMAFPLSKRVGFATGVIPYSSGYYNISSTITEDDPEYDPIIGETENRHKGGGSYSQVFAGLGIIPVKGLSVGATVSFLFGELIRENVYLFLDDNNYYHNLRKERILLRGLNFNYGIQYTVDFNNDFFSTAGFTFTTRKDYKAEYENIFSKYTSYAGTELSNDTLEYVNNEDAHASLPQTIGIGFAFGKRDFFTVAADYRMANWEDCSFFGYESYLVNSNTIAFGVEIIPSKYANFNFLNRVEYRLGGHITDSHLMINSEQLKEIGITFGAGLPLNRTKSRINVHFEYLNRSGSYENGLHSERCFNLGVSFNFYDNWFLKKVYY